MELMKDVYFIYDINLPKPELFCKVFEDNQGCIAATNSNIFLPRIKHIDIKYHYF